MNIKATNDEEQSATIRAEKLIQYVKENCTQSQVMLNFLEQPLLKTEMEELIQNFKSIEDKINKDQN